MSPAYTRSRAAAATAAPLPWVRRAVLVLHLLTAVGLIVLGGLGIASLANWDYLGPLPLARFALDREGTAPSLGSALLLVGGATFAATAAIYRPRSGAPLGRLPLLAWAAVLELMAADELLSLHQSLQRLLRVDWHSLYLPLGAGAGVLWAASVWRLWAAGQSGVPADQQAARRPLLLLAGGGACWALAQLLDFVLLELRRYDAHSRALAAVPEELLELLGSAGFALAFLAVLVAGSLTRRDR